MSSGLHSSRRRLAGVLCLMLSLASFAFMFLHAGGPSFLQDRWHRADLADRFPSGEPSQSLLLTNSGDVPAFAEIRCAAWGEPRPELLLPGQSQMVEIPQSAGPPTEVRYFPLDMQAPDAMHVVPLPPGYMLSRIEVDADGTVTSRSRPGGDSSPKRGLVGVRSEYPLPLRVEVPYDAHERPSERNYERCAWMGPGVRRQGAQCAYALDRTVAVTVWVPRGVQPERVIEVGSGDGATRLTMKADGTVERDTIPAWRRLAQAASF